MNIKLININHFYLEKVSDFVGFAVDNASKGEMVKVLTRASLISDQNDFYTYIDQISEQFLTKFGSL